MPKFLLKNAREAVLDVHVLLATVLAANTWAHGECVKFHLEVFTFQGCGVFEPLVCGQAVAANGAVAGSWTCLIDDRGFLWSSGPVIEPIPIPPGFDSAVAVAINSEQSVIGQVNSQTGGPATAFLFKKNGESSILRGLLPGGQVQVFAMNDAGVIAGTSAVPGQSGVHACLWIDEKPIDLNTTLHGSYAFGLNEVGQVVGRMGSPSHAFLWKDGMTTDLGNPIGSIGAEAKAINDDGVVVGMIRFPIVNGIQPRHAFIWKDGIMTDIGTVPGDPQTIAQSIDDRGVVFGNSTSGDWLYKDGEFLLLRDVLDPAWGIRAFTATRMNRHGQITGILDYESNMFWYYGFLLTPIPAVPGDTNCDRVVNIDDFTEVILNWNSELPPAPFSGSPDLDASGHVDIEDLTEVILNWSFEPPGKH